ncbi:sialate O-acetylesterase [Pseudomonas sp. SWRI100]|uniref:hypothetical protein n=1 Tax=Pseudomonas TaxID=286 RepID=UPI001646809B|nr:MULTISPECIES: hypothetical protein [Pseudomonas]MBC3496182.1 hypothetical protein [Pseudomonas sp. SWRI67]MBV4525432.1 sialate O-acetylesterase [Pseudomonas kermanshahensis]
MSGAEDLARLTQTIDKADELLLSPEVKMMDVGSGVMRPTNAMVMTNLATQLGGAMPYTSVAEGLSATVDGTNFSVLSSAQDEYVTVFRNESGSAVFVDAYPNADAMRMTKGVADSARDAGLSGFDLADPFMLSSSMATGYTDQDGNPILGVRKDGVAFALLDELPGLGMLSKFAWAIVDSEHYVIFGIRWDGSVYMFGEATGDVSVYLENGDVFCLVGGVPYQITSTGLNYNPEVSGAGIAYLSRSGPIVKQLAQIPVPGSRAPFAVKFLHIVGGGQSLVMGAQSAVTTVLPPIANRLFTIQNGVRLANQDDTLTSNDVAPFKPMIAVYTETPIVQHAAQLGRRGTLPSDVAVLVSLHGRNGYTISQLSKGSLYYQNSITAITAAKAECDALGVEYDVPYIDWIQGEANNAMPEEEYYQALIQLQADYEADLNAIIGRSKRRPLLLSQISNWTAYNRAESGVPFAQIRAALDFPDRFVCAGPKYWLPTVPDGIHLPAESSMRLGCMHGMAGERVINGRSWLPTHCTRAVRVGRVVTLDFHTPHGELAFDTSAVSDPGNWGLRYVDSAGPVAISSVRLLGRGRVAVTLSADPTGTGAYVGIADIGTSGAAGGPTTGARSCLRDSEIIKDGYGRPFYNWAVHQRVTVEN